MHKHNVKQDIQDSFHRDPILFTGALSALLIGASKMMQALNDRSNAKSCARETKRRERDSKKK